MYTYMYVNKNNYKTENVHTSEKDSFWVSMPTWADTYIHTYTHTHIYIYIHTYIYIHIYIYTIIT